MKKRIAVLISGSGSTMENLCVQLEEKYIPAEVVLIVSSRKDAYGLELAERRGIKTAVVSSRANRNPEFSEQITALLTEAQVDLVILGGFKCFYDLPEQFLGRVLNVHPALLPSFGGKGMYGHFVHEAVLAHGCRVSGCTVHFVDNAYDTGPILLQAPVAVKIDDTPDLLAERVQAMERKLFPVAVDLVVREKVKLDGSRVVFMEEPEIG